MARRSLQASSNGIDLIRKVLKRKKMSQTVLAARVDCSRQTIWSLLRGNAIDCDVFLEVCTQLGLDWEEIAVSEIPELEDSPELDALIERARKQVASDIDHRCGWMRVLDMQQPIGLSAIYTDVNILERVIGKTRRDLNELMRGCTAETFDRFFLGQVREERVDGLKAVRDHRQLIILGRPGAGKTTFLKRLATLCNRGEFSPEQVPIFVTLKEFAETENQPGLLNFIASFFVPNLSMAEVDQLLLQGRGLVLLDGLDEVLEAQHDRVLREIREFARRYAQGSIVITCRIAAREYIFEQFTEVEVADFGDEQIQDFADKWFREKEPEQLDSAGRSTVGQLFWQALEERKPIKELATNPLLLTLLCFEFEESSEFPRSRAELYERGLNILLSKWDGQRRIKRDEVYKRLPTKRKVSLLGQLARQTFERGDYFFRVHVAERLISQYIQNLPEISADPEALLVDSRAVLESIEAQHGLLTERATDIYSFSHLTFHEYFTAKNILDITDPNAQEIALGQLVDHLTENRWREVLLLVTERMDSADYLLTLMKQRIDQLLAQDEKLQQFLTWVEQKSRSVDAPYKPAAIRAFYLDLDQIPNLDALDQDLDFDVDLDSDQDLDFDVDLDSAMYRDYDFDRSLDFASTIDQKFTFGSDFTLDLDLNRALNLCFAFNINLYRNCGPDLQQKLQQLKDQLPVIDTWESYKKWWEDSGYIWTEQFRETIIQHRNIGHDWQFTDVQLDLLKQYHDANELLVGCLNSDCYVSREVREGIETTLLLPYDRTR
ncbi:MAG: NACHT domain-containing NTPase [Plectolyngbya sp. WJT66-NPBG17]|jgi:predicted NACHT family NTPase|nr:NACHT domain-containing NTPase [Plectolyngbya sp. WJT66-NPBG17]